MKRLLPFALALAIGFISGWLVTVHTQIPLPEPEHTLVVDWLGFVWVYD